MTYTQPLLTIFLLLTLAAFLGGPGRRRKLLAIAGLAGLFLISWPPADWLLSRPLEARYGIRPFEAQPGLQAIVVFSGLVRSANFARPYAIAGADTYERCLYAAWIYRRYGPLPVVVSGGPSAPGFPAEALTMQDILVRNGVDASNVWVEGRSGTTHQNALYSASILRQHGVSRVALVVDARCMLRASACLRKLGIEVDPAVSGYRIWRTPREELLPSWKAIQSNESTLHEAVGLLWYRLRGWI
ncbi:MAG: YdcF family protein [Bryobacteraceae bacterium]